MGDKEKDRDREREQKKERKKSAADAVTPRMVTKKECILNISFFKKHSKGKCGYSLRANAVREHAFVKIK